MVEPALAVADVAANAGQPPPPPELIVRISFY